jgi:hypothetical protein
MWPQSPDSEREAGIPAGGGFQEVAVEDLNRLAFAGRNPPKPTVAAVFVRALAECYRSKPKASP